MFNSIIGTAMADYPLHAKRIPEDSDKTIFARFKSLASRLFMTGKDKPKTDHHITGRIQTLKDDARQVLDELNALKEDLERDTDPDLVKSIEAVVNPIIRDVQRLRRIQTPTNVTEQMDAVRQYTQWIDRAKPWAYFFAHNLKNRSAIIQAVVSYTIRNSAEMIARDLQVIYDYEKHKLLEAQVSEEKRSELQQVIENDLSQLVKKLISLQHDIPKNIEKLTIKQLEPWKKRVARLREEYYNQSLQAIDKAISQVIPSSLPTAALNQSSLEREMHDHVILNLTRIVVLEESIVPLLEEVHASEPLDPDSRIEIATRLAPLEEDANLLHQELRLTPELADRLQAVQQMLDEVKMLLVA